MNITLSHIEYTYLARKFIDSIRAGGNSLNATPTDYRPAIYYSIKAITTVSGEFTPSSVQFLSECYRLYPIAMNYLNNAQDDGGVTNTGEMVEVALNNILEFLDKLLGHQEKYIDEIRGIRTRLKMELNAPKG